MFSSECKETALASLSLYRLSIRSKACGQISRLFLIASLNALILTEASGTTSGDHLEALDHYRGNFLPVKTLTDRLTQYADTDTYTTSLKPSNLLATIYPETLDFIYHQ